MKRTSLIETIIFFYAVLFLYTGISKLIDYDVFRENIADSPILATFATPIAWGLPWIEFLVTAMMIIPRWRLKGLYASLALMLAFTAYIVAILLFDEHLPCSCGGILQQLSWPQHIVLNLVFIILAIGGITLQKKQKKEHQLKLSVNL
jgi:uncharacterized membrane protein YphA (DoxX/SURF4 family)